MQKTLLTDIMVDIWCEQGDSAYPRSECLPPECHILSTCEREPLKSFDVYACVSFVPFEVILF